MSQRIPTLTQPQGKAKELLDGIEKSYGAVPNFYKTFANSPVAFEAYLNFSKKLTMATSLSTELKEKIALTMAGINTCTYCASAHTFSATKLGMSSEELALNLQGKTADTKDQVALEFVLKVAQNRGELNDEDIEAVKSAGFSDEQLVDIITYIGVNTMTNYFNEVFNVDIDFPKVNLDK